MCIRRQYSHTLCGHADNLSFLHYCPQAVNATQAFRELSDITHPRANAACQAIGPPWAANPATLWRTKPCKRIEREKEDLKGYCPSCALKFLDVVDQPFDLTEVGGKIVPKKGVTLPTPASKKQDAFVAKMAGFLQGSMLMWDEEVEREERVGRERARIEESGEEVGGLFEVAFQGPERIKGGRREKGRRK